MIRALSHRWPVTLCFLTVLLLAGAMGPAVHAQQSPDLERRIKNVEKQLKAVQRRVFSGDDTYFDTAPPDNGPIAAAPAGEPGLLADLQIRLSSLERQLRELTGRIEEQDYRARQQEAQMTRFREDVEYRLGQLEGGTEGAAAAQASSTPATPALQPQAPAVSDDAALPAPKPLPPRPEPEQSTPARLDPIPEPAAEAETAAQDPSTPQAATPKALFEDAFAALRRGDYDRAEQGFNDFLGRYRDDPLASNAQYWLGRTYFVRRDYGRAAGAFLAGYQDYPDGEKAADSLLDLGVTLIELDQKQDACAAFDQLRQSFPNASARLIQRMESESARAGCG